MENERERVSYEIQIRILKNEIEHLKDDIADLNKTIYNDGQGMVFEVKQLKYDRSSAAARWSAVVSTLAVLISLASVLIQLFK